MIQRIIDRTLAPRFAAAIAALLVLPSLAGGLALDDLAHRAQALGRPIFAGGSPRDLFRFADGDPEHVRAMRDLGVMPWFADDHLRIAFMRPLSALTHFLDYAVLRLPVWAMHAESIAIYALLVFLVARLYRRVLPTAGVAGLAALLYAVDAGHGFPAGWLANRNAALAAMFGAATLLAHDRWRRDAWRPGAIVAPAMFVLALASGEVGLGAFCYVAAHALTLDRAPRSSRAWSLAPYAGVMVAWQVVYRALGYGVFGSGLYYDPARMPWVFARASVTNAPVLAAGELVLLPPELVFCFPHAAPWLAAIAAAIVLLAAWALAPLVRRDPTARFFALGAALAIAPVCVTGPSSRILLFVGIGGVALIAQLAAAVAAKVETRRPARAFAYVAAGAHLTVAPLVLTLSTVGTAAVARMVDASGPGLPGPSDLVGRTVVIVHAQSHMLAGYRFCVPHEGSLLAPKELRVLSSGTGARTITRVDARTLEIRSASALVNEPLAEVFRTVLPRAGESFRLSDLSIAVSDGDADGAGRTGTFRFDAPLDQEDERVWLAWDHGRYVRFSPPKVGQSVVLED